MHPGSHSAARRRGRLQGLVQECRCSCEDLYRVGSGRAARTAFSKDESTHTERRHVRPAGKCCLALPPFLQQR